MSPDEDHGPAYDGPERRRPVEHRADGDDQLAIGWGKASIAAKGVNLIMALLLAGNIALTLWVQREVMTAGLGRYDALVAALNNLGAVITAQNIARQKEHWDISEDLDKLTCVYSLTREEILKFRASKDSWNRWCWWVKERYAP